MNIDFAEGEEIFVLNDYVFERAVVVSARGAKTILVETEVLGSDCKMQPYRRRVAREKCVWKHERIAIVWEMWKGRNGRGGYRIERELYADQRDYAYKWEHEQAWNFIQEKEEPK